MLNDVTELMLIVFGVIIALWLVTRMSLFLGDEYCGS